MRYLRWAAPAALISGAIALSACGGGMSPAPTGPGLNGVSGATHAGQTKRLTIVGMHSVARCSPKKFPAGCYAYSISSGLDITWCYGPPASPCEDTDQITNWGGPVMKVKTGKVIKQIKVAWTGPFPCDGVRCTTGTYEDDSMMTGKRTPKQSKGKNSDEQIVTGCLDVSCGNLTAIGLTVGP